jgi:hypothetical protein
MIRTITPYFIICSALIHIFCCGIPLLLSITSLTNIIGISSLAIFEIEWFESVEGYILLFSGFLLIANVMLDRFSKKINCVEIGACQHEPCHEKKLTSSHVLNIAIILYAVSLFTLVLGALTA